MLQGTLDWMPVALRHGVGGRILVLLIWALAAVGSPAQTVGGGWKTHLEIGGTGRGQVLGWSIAPVGDLNQDGCPDFLAGAPSWGGWGYAMVFSGVDGSPVLLVRSIRMDDSFGQAVGGAGDVDADGVPDLVVGAPHGTGSPGAVAVYSGRNGSLLQWFEDGQVGDSLGFSVDGAGDLNGDGFDDVVVGAPFASPGGVSRAGRVLVLSGRDEAILHEFPGRFFDVNMGTSVAGAGDVDGDGVPDIIAGAPYASPANVLHAGSAFVYSGSDGRLLHRFDGQYEHMGLGNAVAGVGDMDEDGLADVIVCADGRFRYVVVYSGATGREIHRVTQNADRFGVSAAGAGDVDRDGIPDFIVGASEAEPGGIHEAGSAFVYSGRTGLTIHRVDGREETCRLGVSVASVGDVNGDGFNDLATGAVSGLGTSRGAIVVFGVDPFLELDGDSLSVSSGVPVGASMDFPDEEGLFFYALLMSGKGEGPSNLGGLEVPLSPDPLLRRMLSKWIPPFASNVHGRLDYRGRAAATLAGHPILAPHVGRTLYLAAVSYDRTGPVPRLSSVSRSLVLTP